MSKKVTVTAECEACRTTGVYSGISEPRGVAVICRECGGRGSVTITYTPFIKRRVRKGIKKVRLSHGTLIPASNDSTPQEISYNDFQNMDLSKKVG